MGGNIKVKSQEGVGSNFYFSLNLITGDPNKSKLQISIDKPAADYNLLIIENHAETAESIKIQLDYWNIKSQYANNIEDSIQLLKKNNFDLIFVNFDLRMISGDKTVERLQKAFPEMQFKIVFLTPYKSKIEVDKLKKTEMFNFMTKPVIQNKLKKILEKELGTKSVSPQSKPTKKEKLNEEATSSLDSFHILIAEDQIINTKIISQLLSRKGFKFTATENGLIALDEYKSNADKYDMILMDVQMPEMDGLEATSEIRKFEGSSDRHIPIVAMTAHAMKGDKEKFIDAGMDDYLSKPVNPKKLYSTIEKYLK